MNDKRGNRSSVKKTLAIDVVTLFPSYFEGPLQASLLGKAQKKGLVKVRAHDLRDYTHDRHKTADDKPYGGGPGMVMKPEPIFECIEDLQSQSGKKNNRKREAVILLDPQGEPFSQKIAAEFAKKKRLILISGHYEGVDQRVRERLIDREISVGDFVTMGGEAPALCLIEAIVRLIPGVLGNEASVQHESFQAGLLEYPQYTRPRVYRGMEVPEILVSGHHREVAKWRQEMAERLTRSKRPDIM